MGARSLEVDDHLACTRHGTTTFGQTIGYRSESPGTISILKLNNPTRSTHQVPPKRGAAFPTQYRACDVNSHSVRLSASSLAHL